MFLMSAVGLHATAASFDERVILSCRIGYLITALCVDLHRRCTFVAAVSDTGVKRGRGGGQPSCMDLSVKILLRRNSTQLVIPTRAEGPHPSVEHLVF